jgi:MFS family permease
LAGRAFDTGRISLSRGIFGGIVFTAAGLASAALPGLAGLLCAAVIIGLGCGIITPLAFTMLAESTPDGRLGQTMGAAEVGREFGDAAGPLVVGAAAAASTVPLGFVGLAAIVASAGLVTAVHRRAGGDSGPR